MKKPYPILLDLTNKEVAVIGGGRVAARKINGLLAAGADVTVISPTLSEKIDATRVTWLPVEYQRQLVTEMDLIFTCTNQSAVNRQVRDEATHFQLVNDTSHKTASDFYNVATINRENLMLMVSTNGASPSYAKKLKQDLIEWLDSRGD